MVTIPPTLKAHTGCPDLIELARISADPAMAQLLYEGLVCNPDAIRILAKIVICVTTQFKQSRECCCSIVALGSYVRASKVLPVLFREGYLLHNDRYGVPVLKLTEHAFTLLRSRAIELGYLVENLAPAATVPLPLFPPLS